MKTVIILCGVAGSGKTKTLKSFFGLDPDERLGRFRLLEKTLDGEKIYAFSLSSPQEQEDFCEVEDVKANIAERIQKCENASLGNDYTLIIPFTISRKRVTEEYNEECIIEPINWLTNRGFHVYTIYLRKLRPVDIIMKRITSNELESIEKYDRQARELEGFLKTL